MSDFKHTLVNFYRAHNPEKLDGVDGILQRFEGNRDRLVEELEKKYGVVFAAYAPAASVVAGGTSPSEGVAPMPPPPPPPLLAAPVIQMAGVDRENPMVLSLRADITALKYQLEAARAEKEATAVQARKDAVVADARLQEARKASEQSRAATTARDASLAQQLRAAEARTEALEAALKAVQAEVATRAEQVVAAVHEKQGSEAQLGRLIEFLGRGFDPYAPAANQDGVTAASEVAVLMREKLEAGWQAAEQARTIEQLVAAVATLKAGVREATSGSDVVKAQLVARDVDCAELRAALALRVQEVEQLRRSNAAHAAEVDRLRTVIAVAVRTRIEERCLAEQDRRAVAAAARQRISEAAEGAAMLAHDCAAQDAELVQLARQACAAEVAAVKQELDDLSRALFEARSGRAAAESNARAMRVQLKRAAEGLLRFAPTTEIAAYMGDGANTDFKGP
jgi:hypothetical protein